MPLRRRTLLAAGLAVAAPALVRAQETVVVSDLLGRTVRLDRPARRIVLGQGRLLSLMGLLHPDPVSLLAGWASDLPVVLPDEYSLWRKRFPEIDTVPQLGRRVLGDMSLEAVVQLQPDLILLNRMNAGAVDAEGRGETLDKVAALGIPVAVIDCMAEPLRDTLPSIGILGALLGRPSQAAALSEFYTAGLTRLDRWFADHSPPMQRVLLHNHGGGRECCYSIAQGSFAALLLRVAARSIAADLLRRPLGQLHKEYVLTHPADAYVTTGGVYNGRGGVSLGAGIAPDLAARSLADMLRAQGLAELPPVADGRAFALWHGFNEMPQHLVALEALAGWLHPDARAMFDPRPTMEAFNKRFSAVPFQGTYWTSLSG